MRKLYPCASICFQSVDLLGYEKDGEKFKLMAYLQDTSIVGSTVTPVLLAHSITEEEAQKYLTEFHEWKEDKDKRFNELMVQFDFDLEKLKKENAPNAEVPT